MAELYNGISLRPKKCLIQATQWVRTPHVSTPHVGTMSKMEDKCMFYGSVLWRVERRHTHGDREHCWPSGTANGCVLLRSVIEMFWNQTTVRTAEYCTCIQCHPADTLKWLILGW